MAVAIDDSTSILLHADEGNEAKNNYNKENRIK